MFKLCRIVKEGPAPATKAAVNISKKAIEQWQGQSLSGTFITNKYMHRMTSKSVSQCLADFQQLIPLTLAFNSGL